MGGKTAQHDVFPQETCYTVKTGYILQVMCTLFAMKAFGEGFNSAISHF